jgi:hypothetical protein
MANGFSTQLSPDDVVIRHEFGQAVSNLSLEITTRDPKFEALGSISKQMVREFRRFAEIVDKDELSVLVGLRSPLGNGLSWAMMRRLIGISKRAQRLKTAQRPMKMGWTNLQLFLAIRHMRPYTKGSGGRPIIKPTSSDEAAAIFNQAINRFTRVIDVCIRSRIGSASAEAKVRAKQRILQAQTALRSLKRVLSTANE